MVSERFPLPKIANERPIMTIFAGPNGAGKSTLRELWSGNRSLGIVIDADALAKDKNFSDVMAGRETIRMVNECIRNGESFALETTLSGNLIFEQIDHAKDQGFLIHLLYVSLTSPIEHQKRVEQRIARGGHAIPPDDVIRRFYRSHANLPKAMVLADRVDVYTNTSKCESIVQIEQGKIINQATKKPLWIAEILKQY